MADGTDYIIPAGQLSLPFAEFLPTSGTVASTGRFAKFAPKYPGLIKAAGPVGAGFIAGDLIQGNEGDVGGVRDYLGNAAKFAGIGGTIGSFFPGPGTAIGAGIGGLFGLGFEYFDKDTGKIVPGSIPLPPRANQNLSIDELTKLYDKYMGGGGGGGGAAAANRAEMQALQDYWRNLNLYGQNRSAALRDMFSGVSAARARSGAATQRAGTDLAADIENLYNRLGASAGQPVVAEGSPTAGLAPASGEMAMAPLTIPSEGGSLANYLATATGAQAQNIYDIAAAQALQGTALSQNYLDALAMAEQQAILNQRQRAAARIAQAQAQAAAYNRERGNFLMQAELNQRLSDAQFQDARSAALFNLGMLQTTDNAQYKQIDKIAKGLGFANAEAFADSRPDLYVSLATSGK